MRCSKCNAKLSPNDVWCLNCGRQTRLIKEELSALRSLARTWGHMSSGFSAYVPAGAVSIIFGVLPIVILIWLFSGLLGYQDETTASYLAELILKTLSVSLFLPFVMTPFSSIARINSSNYELGFKQAINSLGKYPRYLGVALISALFYILATIICYGLPDFGSDPILKLVWIVLMNYWLALSLPVPMIMERMRTSPWRAYRISYRCCHDVRWNLYLLGLILLLSNLLGTIPIVIGLTITLPVSWFTIRDYVDLLFAYGVIPYQNNPLPKKDGQNVNSQTNSPRVLNDKSEFKCRRGGRDE